MKKLLYVVVCSFLFVSGCALSPQEVDVSPRVHIAPADRNLSGAINVSVIDQRGSHTLGSRGGVYGGTNEIITSDDLPISVQSAVEFAVRQMGLIVTDAESAPQLTIYLDKLEYRVPDASYITHVELSAAARVVVKEDGRMFEGRYQSDLSEKVLKAPSDEKNTELVNAVLSDVLARAFAEHDLKAFLRAL